MAISDAIEQPRKEDSCLLGFYSGLSTVHLNILVSYFF